MTLFTAQRGETDHDNWPIEDVLDRYGWDGRLLSRRKWSRVRCPFHIDRNPSAAISHELNSFRCFSCDRSGNSVTLVMAEEGLTAEQAVAFLDAELEGVSQNDRSKPRKQYIPWEPAF